MHVVALFHDILRVIKEGPEHVPCFVIQGVNACSSRTVSAVVGHEQERKHLHRALRYGSDKKGD